MMMMRATAIAHPNIAFIKFWGMEDELNRFPVNDSLSMTIGPLVTRTTVEFDPNMESDVLILNNEKITGRRFLRFQKFMDHIRNLGGTTRFARVESENNFPTGTGLASSASGFAALALAGTAALGLPLSEIELSNLARLGSGSACRSIPGGFVEWQTDSLHGDSYAVSIASPDHWELVDCIAILSQHHKPVSSEIGMLLAFTSPLQKARVRDTPRRMEQCRTAILRRDFTALAEVIELDSNMMHAVMMTSNPPLFYWHPQSLAIMTAIKNWQLEGLQVSYTLDAGPNVHVICTQAAMPEVMGRLRAFPGVIEVIKGFPAGPTRLVKED